MSSRSATGRSVAGWYAEFLEAVVGGPGVAAQRRGAPVAERRGQRSRRRQLEYLAGLGDQRRVAASIWRRTRRAWSRRSRSRRRAGPCDRILEMGAYLQITPALHTKLGYGEVRGCYYGKLGRDGSSRGHIGGGRDVRLRHRPFRRREGPVSVSRRALLDGPLLRTDRAPVRRSDAPDGGGQPDPEAGRTLRADHAEHRGAARDLGDPAGLSSGLLPRLHQAGGIGRSGRAPQSRIHAARDSPACWRTRASKWRCSRPASSATSRIRSSAG